MNKIKSAHTCYIPVMGTGFTIDTPLKVAKFGISSVISLVDDVLIEQMREHYCKLGNIEYSHIASHDQDARAKRITAYLDLLNSLIAKQSIALQNAPFVKESDITRYYEFLPESPSKKLYKKMLVTKNAAEKERLQTKLRQLAVPGSIDVNIMTKLDRVNKDATLHSSDAQAALRGYAKSSLDSSVVFSAGFNPQLYGYLTDFEDFLPDENGYLKKRITLKVSDYRSAFIQGKYLAKHALWVSEYRVESALNCGGHAFVNDGHLLGPILEEFKQNREELIEILHGLYTEALAVRNKPYCKKPHSTRFTAQGGVGTCNEHEFLLKRYELDAVGWGTPFLLVPDAVNLDDEHMQKLAVATDKDVFLSDSSPLGIPYWNLSNSASENSRREKISAGCPGSNCLKQYVKMNTEFGAPICIASHAYQKQKLLSLAKDKLAANKLQELIRRVLAKSCICHDLAAAATKKYGIDPNAKTAVCPGPNIVNFSKIATLDEMLEHIYGRISLLTSTGRPHMFIKELSIHVEFLKKELKDSLLDLAMRSQDKLQIVKKNLLDGIEYYRKLVKDLVDEQQKNFSNSLNYFYSTLLVIDQ